MSNYKIIELGEKGIYWCFDNAEQIINEIEKENNGYEFVQYVTNQCNNARQFEEFIILRKKNQVDLKYY